ncbi:MAG: phospholipase D-like domain-containing protein [Bacteroidota bacterium]|nr:phospholipase D-like domain-containing protein [Bacteroidota bacterium]
MKSFKAIIFSVILTTTLFFYNSLFAQSESTYQIVESVPIETDLGLDETERTFEVWMEIIKKAQHSIEIECFYVSNKAGEPLEDILSEIKKSAKRGVQVRFLVDAKMKKTYPQPLDDLNKIKNIEVRATNYFNKIGGVIHTKYILVDREILFIGSQNFDWRALKHIHEVGFNIKNEKLAQMFGLIFDLDWKIASDDRTDSIEKYFEKNTIQMINSKNPITLEVGTKKEIKLYPSFSPKNLIYSGMNWDEDEIIKLIDKAESEILIQLLSYSVKDKNEYYSKLDNAIRSASIRGVNVNIILSDWSKGKSKLPYLNSLAMIPNVKIHFTTIPEWSGGQIPYSRVEHCKFLLVDEQYGWLGTSNWAKDYFYKSRNMGIVFESKFVAEIIHKMFYKSWDSEYTNLILPNEKRKSTK